MSQKLGKFPSTRLRRLRKKEWIRKLTEECEISSNDLIFPLFLQEDSEGEASEIKNLPGVLRYNITGALKKCEEIQSLGINAIALFPAISDAKKDECGTEATNGKNLICSAVREIKKQGFNFGVICDVALDPYTSHGHDGIVENDEVANDPTIDVLCKQAVVQAEAGCDIIAPSDMMDGRVEKIRQSLDGKGFQDVMIMSYAAKYASSFYGPFRDAIGSKRKKPIDKRAYQMSPANSDEALREVAMDIQEGADMLLIKPGITNLDIIHRVSQEFHLPTFAYQVSGEYAMIALGAKQGLFDKNTAMLESLTALKRAGSRGVFTYAATEIAQYLRTIKV